MRRQLEKTWQSKFCCPSCGHALPDRPDPHKLLEFLLIAGIRGAVLRVLVANFAREVPTEVVCDLVYSSQRNGGPEGARAVIKAHARDLRKLLKPHGLTVRGSQYGTFRLDWSDAPALERLVA